MTWTGDIPELRNIRKIPRQRLGSVSLKKGK
jgi:hypothetical protein